MSNYTNGQAQAWAFRWLDSFNASKYCVTVGVEGFGLHIYAAVVDDFGNLVKVDQ